LYVHERVRAELVDALADLARTAKVADGALPGTQLGPVNNKPQYDRVEDLVSDAVRNGARTVAGGRALDSEGYFLAPTILDSVDDGIRVVDEEQFGPVLPIIGFTDETDVIARANNGNYGLTASVWSSDQERALRLASEIDTGQVSINIHGGGVRTHLPFGGRKWSGVGVENGPWGLAGFQELQAVTVERRTSPAG
jgi:acyl-CoA reductase-like NAD-dependent aldehyde dehydrogenase